MSELDCEETIRLLEGFADGELDAVTGFGVQEHLDHCEACRTRWRWHRDLAASLERIATERQHPPSPSLRRRVLRDAAATTGALESNESRGRSPRRRTVKRILMGAAGLLLILAPLMTGLSPESRGEDPSRLGDARDLPEAMDFVRDHEKVDSGEAKFLYASDPGATWTALKSPFADRTAVPAARIANYRFAGARFCRVGSRPVVHALYEKQGQRVSAFVLEEVLAEIDGLHHLKQSRGGSVVSGVCQGRTVALVKGARNSLVLVGDVSPRHISRIGEAFVSAGENTL